MSIISETPRAWIVALFKRSDGERFVLGDGFYEFKSGQQHFTANEYVNDTVDLQGADGTLLAGQVRRASSQDFDGYIGDATVPQSQIENRRRAFLRFFRKDYYYEVVYIFADGRAIKRNNGFITDAPEVKELYQLSPEYHVSLNFEDVNYYEYLENDAGDEIYGHRVNVYSETTQEGGVDWDNVGAVWDDVGVIWEAGNGRYNDVTVESVDLVYPVITITAETKNPEFECLQTSTHLRYTGNVVEGQTLVIDCLRQTAKLNGTNVVSSVSGDWLALRNGTNRLVYQTDNTSPSATMEWSAIVG